MSAGDRLQDAIVKAENARDELRDELAEEIAAHLTEVAISQLRIVKQRADQLEDERDHPMPAEAI